MNILVNKVIKFLSLLMFYLCIMVGVKTANALTMNEDGTYVTSKGIKITNQQYNVLKERGHIKLIDKFDEGIINVLSSNSVVIKGEYKTEAKSENFNNIYTNLLDLSSNNNYTSPSKTITIEYYNDEEGAVIHIYNNWLSMPKIRKYDVIAARWDNNVTGISIYATQSSNVGDSFYDASSDHTKISSKGVGVSMNLYDKATSLSNDLYVYSPNKSAFGNNAYGTYQHARHSNVTLSISKAYSISPSGYGGVLYWSNSTYRNYFDNMTGVTAY